LKVLGGLILLLVVVGVGVYFKKRKSESNVTPANTCAALRAQMEGMACPETIAFDWGDVARFREVNLKLAPLAAGERRVVFFGDSITYRWAALEQPKRFEDVMGVNRGIPGQITSQMLLRFRQDVVELHPSAVVILAGTNDLARLLPPALPVIEANLASMTQLAQANGIRTVLASVLPVNDYETDSSGKLSFQTRTRPPQQIRELNEWLKKYAAEHNCIFADYYSVLVDSQGFMKKGYSVDGLHPNDAGYQVMEPVAAAALKAAKLN
jgi:acyl-CoA thioesterase I